MATCDVIRYILLTGPPGIGKTTLIRRVCDQFKAESDLRLRGFITEEMRDARTNERIGFEIVDIITGRRAPLASSTSSPAGTPRVGKYSVILDQFQPLALECLSMEKDDNKSGKNLVVIDEIGKMESFSRPFCEKVERLFDKAQNPHLTVLATVPIDKGNLPSIVKTVKNTPGTRLITVTRENRDQVVHVITEAVRNSLLITSV